MSQFLLYCLQESTVQSSEEAFQREALSAIQTPKAATKPDII